MHSLTRAKYVIPTKHIDMATLVIGILLTALLSWIIPHSSEYWGNVLLYNLAMLVGLIVAPPLAILFFLVEGIVLMVYFGGIQLFILMFVDGLLGISVERRPNIPGW